MRKVISNTSCLIALSNIGHLELLKDVYGAVTITDEVAAEFVEPVPEWIEISTVKDPVKASWQGQIAETTLCPPIVRVGKCLDRISSRTLFRPTPEYALSHHSKKSTV